MLIHVFCKICEREIVFVSFLGHFLVLIFIELKTLMKPVNNQTNCRIAFEKLKKILIYLTIIFFSFDLEYRRTLSNEFLQTF